MDPLSERFRQQRERTGLTTRELEHMTTIRERFIKAIELGRYDVLPAVYVRSFIRTLGAALEIPPGEVNALMERTFGGDGESPTHLAPYVPEPPPRESAISFATAAQRTQDAVAAQVEKIRSVTPPAHRWQSYAIGLGALALIGAAVWWLVLRDDGASTATTPEDVVEIRSGTTETVPEGDSIILTAVASDTAWVSITMDGTRSQQVVLLPEGEYRWSAMKDFVMSLGNAGAVQFFRNERPLPFFGKKGEAVRQITIKRKDITASNMAYRPPTQQSPAAASQQQPATTTSAPKSVVKPVVKPAATRVTKPVSKPATKTATKPGTKAVTKPAARQAPKRAAGSTRQRVDRPIITPAPPQPIRR
jgi:hypothetical protein